jgi:hypothetical protein
MYRQWRANGRNAAAVATKYRGPKKIHRQELAAIINAAKMPAVTSFRHAVRRIAVPVAGEAAFRKALARTDYDKINRAFAMRRKGAGLLRQAQRLVNSVNSWPKKKVEL